MLFKHQRSYDVIRTPLASAAADVRTRSAPECRYMVLDTDGAVLAAGQVPLADDANFHLDLREKLPAGEFTLVAEIIVNGNAMNAEIRNFPIDAR